MWTQLHQDAMLESGYSLGSILYACVSMLSGYSGASIHGIQYRRSRALSCCSSTVRPSTPSIVGWAPQQTQPWFVHSSICYICLKAKGSSAIINAQQHLLPVEQYSASDMARVVSDLMREAACGLAEQAASREAARALLDDTSNVTPAAAHSSLTCMYQDFSKNRPSQAHVSCQPCAFANKV